MIGMRTAGTASTRSSPRCNAIANGPSAAAAARAAAAEERNSRRTVSGSAATAAPRNDSDRTGKLPKLRYFKPGVFMAAATRATSGSWPMKTLNSCCEPAGRCLQTPARETLLLRQVQDF